MGHLVHRQPATQFVDRHVVLLRPGLNVRLHQDERRGLDRLASKKRGVVLAEDPPSQQSQHQAQIAGDAFLAEAQDQRPGNQLLEALQRLEHLTEDPNVESHPLPAADGRQPRVQAFARRGHPRPERFGQERLELGRDRPVGLLLARVPGQVRRLATAVERDLLHPLPIDQPGGLLPRTDELAEDHSPNADGDPPGHGAADPPGRGDGFRHAHGGGPPPPRPESHSTDARRGWRSKRSIASTRRLGVLKCGYYRPGIRGRLPTHY